VARTVLDKELQELDSQIRELGSLVDAALERALQSLATGDLSLASQVIESDTLIDSLRITIEEHTIRLLTLQQPLGIRDLRFLTSALSIAGDLERTGDGAEGIAQIILRMTPLKENAHPVPALSAADNSEVTEQSILRDLVSLGQEARNVLRGTLKAFADMDASAARAVWQDDDLVDVRYHTVRHNLMTMLAGAHAIPALQSDARILQRATYLLWIAHKLERVGDHAANICERIIFIVEGESNIKTSQDGEDK